MSLGSRATGAVLAIRFATELALVAAAAWAAAAHLQSVLAAVVLGVVGAGAVAAVWGVWIAPASRRRLPDPGRLALEVVLFVGVAVGLALAGRLVPAIVVGVVGAATAVVVRFLGGTTEQVTRDAVAAEPAAEEPAAADPTAPAPLRRPRGRDRARRAR